MCINSKVEATHRSGEESDSALLDQRICGQNMIELEHNNEKKAATRSTAQSGTQRAVLRTNCDTWKLFGQPGNHTMEVIKQARPEKDKKCKVSSEYYRLFESCVYKKMNKSQRNGLLS